jgi:hypothetical protein
MKYILTLDFTYNTELSNEGIFQNDSHIRHTFCLWKEMVTNLHGCPTTSPLSFD